MHLDGERGAEGRQGQHEAADHRRDPRVAATTRADDQRRGSMGDRGAQRPNLFYRDSFRFILLFKSRHLSTRCPSAARRCARRKHLIIFFPFFLGLWRRISQLRRNSRNVNCASFR
ncbi:hypothetical protein PUN28_004542 [Cardiocondyla obscurior]|uniref:Uncharacterized protein n=1 Tax=Cardiocondyla obscurior TaxID=286306 RepID=A0AAW2GBW4_9HYME